MPPVEAQLKIRRKGFSFTVLDEVDSTNDECARQLAAGRIALLHLRTEADQGRGSLQGVAQRRQRQPLLELCIPSRIAPERMQTFTLWMGVTICELVSKFVPVVPGVKWPTTCLEGARPGGC